MRTEALVDDKEKFRLLAIDQLPRLYSIARRLAGDDAEDAVQECLLKAFRRFHQLDDESAASAWMVSILVNCCRDRGRARSRQPLEVDIDEVEEFSLYRKIADVDPFPYSDSLHLDFLHEFGKEDLYEVLATLPDIYRVPLVLAYMEGFSAKEVGKLLGRPLGTVLAQLHRGRKFFESRMWTYATQNGLLKKGT
jgi:RNA polymerase sigma-70 factor (ECF subfamily)